MKLLKSFVFVPFYIKIGGLSSNFCDWKWPTVPLRNLRYWIASGFMVRGLCTAIALAMTLLEAAVSIAKQRHFKNVIARATINA